MTADDKVVKYGARPGGESYRKPREFQRERSFRQDIPGKKLLRYRVDPIAVENLGYEDERRSRNVARQEGKYLSEELLHLVEPKLLHVDVHSHHFFPRSPPPG